MQVFIERIGENAILIHFRAIIPDIRLSGEPENILTTSYRWLSSSVELWEVICQILFSSVEVIDTVGVVFFQVLLNNY